MNGFHRLVSWFSSQWPRNTRTKKIAKSVVGKSTVRRMLSHGTGAAVGSCAAVDLREPSSEEAAFRGVRRELERPVVRGAGLVATVEPAQQVGPRRVEEVVGREGFRERVDQGKPRPRPVSHRDGDGSV